MAAWILQPAGEGRPPQSRRDQQQGASVGSGSRRAPKSRWTAGASVGQGLGWRRNREAGVAWGKDQVVQGLMCKMASFAVWNIPPNSHLFWTTG
jgi:hypothetical protein